MPSTGRQSPSRKPRPPAKKPPRAQKISVTVDADVLRDVKKTLRRTGRTLSAHVTEALARDLRRRRLQELLDEYETTETPITEAELAEVRSQWLG